MYPPIFLQAENPSQCRKYGYNAMDKGREGGQDSEPLINDRTPKITVDDILNFIGYGPLQLIAFCMVGVTLLAYSIDDSLFAFIDIPVQKKWNISGVKYAIVPAITSITNIVGGFGYGYLSDHFGRVWPYALIVLNIGIFGLASAFSPTFATLAVLRAITSFATSVVTATAIVTLIEFLPVRNRGKVIVLAKMTESVGSCICAGLAWWLIPTYTRDGWRYLVIAAAIPNFLAMIFRLSFHLQSPRYLIAKGRFSEARKVLSQMARFNGKNLSDILPDEYELNELVVIETPNDHNLWKTIKNFGAIFKSPYLKTTVLIGIAYVTEGMSSYGASLFLPIILSRLNVNPYFTAFVGYLGQFPGILLMAIIVEWRYVGRLNALRLFTVLTVISFFLFAFVQNAVSIPVFTILIYFSMVPIDALFNTYISECYPTSIRALALVFFNNLLSFSELFIPFVSGYVSDISIHWLYPVVWAGLFSFQFFVSLFFNFETRGIRLTDTV